MIPSFNIDFHLPVPVSDANDRSTAQTFKKNHHFTFNLLCVVSGYESYLRIVTKA